MNYRPHVFSLAILSLVTVAGLSSCTTLDQSARSQLALAQSSDDSSDINREDAYNSKTLEVKEELKKTVTFEVYSVAEGQRISKARFAERLTGVDYILLGEEHGTVLHHQMQTQVLSQLLQNGRRPPVVMEMLDLEDAGLINSTLRHNPDDPDALARAVDWRNSGWPNWQYYRPIVSAAMKAKTRLIPGNTPGKELMTLAMKGGIDALEPDYVRQIGLDKSLPADGEKQLREILARAHNTEMPEEAVDSMLFAQRMRDAKFAETIIANNSGEGGVLIAGRQHSRNDYGVPFYLKLREPSAKTVSIVSMTENALNKLLQSSAAASTPFEYIWVPVSTDQAVTLPPKSLSSAQANNP